MDNEQLKKYIEENRDALETHVPSAQLWENIEEELHPKKKRRGIIFWGGIAASITAVVGLFMITSNASDSQIASSGWNVNEPRKEGGFEVVSDSNVSESLDVNHASKIKSNQSTAKGTTAATPLPPSVAQKKPELVIEEELMDVVYYSYEEDEEEIIMEEKKETRVVTIVSSDAIREVKLSRRRGLFAAKPMPGKKRLNNTYAWSDDNERIAADSYEEFDTYQKTVNGENYDNITENEFISPFAQPQSTFSIDVDAAGYSNVRRFINNDQLPPANAVKLEEMINYFNYDYPEPTGDHPFAFTTEIGVCPWNKKHRLVHIGMQGKSIEKKDIPASNLVFLIDVSGSMQSADKIELLKKGFKLLTSQLREEDKVSIVVYAGAAGVVLPPTNGTRQEEIIAAIDRLSAGGSTAGGEGINLAYKIATENFKKNGNNRVILATDGDFNVGVSADDDLTKLIEEKRKSGVFLTVLGFGTGNLQASKMEKLADNGNGNFAYIDNSMEAKKVMVQEFGAMFTIAKDVKLQVEFNPAKVKGYRLIGYENRMLAAKDFNDDTKDAGELGAGHTVTALYEIIPVGSDEEVNVPDSTRYFNTAQAGDSDELMQIKFRYKPIKSDKSILLTHIVKDEEQELSQNFYWSASVAELGLLLRDSKFKGDAAFDNAYKTGKKGLNDDKNGYRYEFLSLIKKAESLKVK